MLVPAALVGLLSTLAELRGRARVLAVPPRTCSPCPQPINSPIYPPCRCLQSEYSRLVYECIAQDCSGSWDIWLEEPAVLKPQKLWTGKQARAGATGHPLGGAGQGALLWGGSTACTQGWPGVVPLLVHHRRSPRSPSLPMTLPGPATLFCRC